jgi:hypothetical protein
MFDIGTGPFLACLLASNLISSDLIWRCQKEEEEEEENTWINWGHPIDRMHATGAGMAMAPIHPSLSTCDHIPNRIICMIVYKVHAFSSICAKFS